MNILFMCVANSARSQLPDPAGTGTEENQLLRFQETRNELMDRLNEFYSEWIKSTDKNDGRPDQF